MANPLMRLARSFAPQPLQSSVTEISVREVRLTSKPRPVMVEWPCPQINEAGINEVRLAEIPRSVGIEWPRHRIGEAGINKIQLAAPPHRVGIEQMRRRVSDIPVRPPSFYDGITIAGGRFKQTQLASRTSTGTLVPVGPSIVSSKAAAPLKATRKHRSAPDAKAKGQQPATFDLQALWPLLLPTPKNLTGDGKHFGVEMPHSLYAFQADGVRFLIEHRNAALLADDMGLGKTVQAITAARVLLRRGRLLSVLIVMPKSVITSWIRHLADWAPELRCMAIQAPPEWRVHQWAALRRRSVHVAVATYDTIRIDMARGLVPSVDLLIADEVQNIKNPSAKRSIALAQVVAGHRWGLTGTPLENNLDELVAILWFIDPSRYPTYDSIRYMMLRRRKEEVLDDLPQLVTNVEYIELGPRQRAAYERAEYDGIVELEGKPRNIANVLTLITRLKQICNDVNGESAKMEWLRDYAYSAREEGDKLLVFSQYLDTLSHIERDLAGLQPLKFTGSLNDHERARRIDAFQTRQSRHHMMILQTRAGGVGITLTAANRVVHFDSWWNPAVQSQATARAHRIGQQKTVFEVTLVSENTIEERIQDLLASKRELFDRAINDLSVDGVARLLSREELYGLFGLAA